MAQHGFDLVVVGADMAGFAAIQKATVLGARAAIARGGTSAAPE